MSFESMSAIPVLTEAEAAKVRAILVAICSEEFVAAIEETGLENALESGYTPEDYEAKRAAAPIVVDLLFALDPDFVC